TSRNGQIRMAAERVAVNLPIQGSAADIMKRAMIDVHAALAPHPDARMILTVHDELLFEVPKSRAEEIAALVRDKMESAAALNEDPAAIGDARHHTQTVEIGTQGGAAAAGEGSADPAGLPGVPCRLLVALSLGRGRQPIHRGPVGGTRRDFVAHPRPNALID